MSAADPYLALVRELRRKKVRFLLVGVFGINHYAAAPALEFSTLDCDILVKPDPQNLLKTLSALEASGYRLETGGEPLGKPDLWLMAKIIGNRASVSALKNKTAQVDILTAVAGYSFARLYAARRLFKAGGTLVPVASLKHLIDSKRICGRRKDLEFLRIYAAQERGRPALEKADRLFGASSKFARRTGLKRSDVEKTVRKSRSAK